MEFEILRKTWIGDKGLDAKQNTKLNFILKTKNATGKPGNIHRRNKILKITTQWYAEK